MKLLKFIRNHDISQVELAKILGLSEGGISLKINGGRPWKLDEARQILAHLRDNHDPDLTLDDLFGEPLAEDLTDAAEAGISHG